MKTIGQMAGRMKFTEIEIVRTQGLAYATYELNIELAEKSGLKLSKVEKEKMKETIFKIISKAYWIFKEKCYPITEITEDDFKEFSQMLLHELFQINELTGGHHEERHKPNR